MLKQEDVEKVKDYFDQMAKEFDWTYADAFGFLGSALVSTALEVGMSEKNFKEIMAKLERDFVRKKNEFAPY